MSEIETIIEESLKKETAKEITLKNVSIQPLFNYIHLVMLDPTLKIGELVLVKKDMRPRWGKVMAVGQGTYDITGNIVVPQVKEGDLVFVLLHGPETVQILDSQEKVVFISELDCLARWDYMNSMLEPLGDYVQIEYLSAPDRFSAAGLILPDKANYPKQIAKVIKLGKGLRAPDGSVFPFFVKEGDVILVREHCSLEVSFSDVTRENKTTQLISQNDILGILKENV